MKFRATFRSLPGRLSRFDPAGRARDDRFTRWVHSCFRGAIFRGRELGLPGFSALIATVALSLFVAPVLALEKAEGEAATQPEGMEAQSRGPEAVRIEPRPWPALGVGIWTNRSRYSLGDPVRVYFQVERSARVYIFNTDAVGRTHQIFPNAIDQDNWVRGGITYTIPDARYRLVATGPAGWEELHIVAYADREILYRPFHRFEGRDAPFPERPEGALPLLQRLEEKQNALGPPLQEEGREGARWNDDVEARQPESLMGREYSPETEEEAAGPEATEEDQEKVAESGTNREMTQGSEKPQAGEATSRETGRDAVEPYAVEIRPVYPPPGGMFLYGEDYTAFYVGPTRDLYDYEPWPYLPPYRDYYYYRRYKPYRPYPAPHQPRYDRDPWRDRFEPYEPRYDRYPRDHRQYWPDRDQSEDRDRGERPGRDRPERPGQDRPPRPEATIPPAPENVPPGPKPFHQDRFKRDIRP